MSEGNALLSQFAQGEDQKWEEIRDNPLIRLLAELEDEDEAEQALRSFTCLIIHDLHGYSTASSAYPDTKASLNHWSSKHSVPGLECLLWAIYDMYARWLGGGPNDRMVSNDPKAVVTQILHHI
jgi:hypothetical protein